MSERVRAVTASPLFTYTKSNEKLSAIAVETNVQNLPIAALYIGKFLNIFNDILSITMFLSSTFMSYIPHNKFRITATGIQSAALFL